MVQRLGLAVAALPDTPLLLLDEPTAALDPEGLSAFYALVEGRRREGRTILFTSHRMEEVEALADEVIVMEKGKTLRRCPAWELATEPELRTQVKLRMPTALLDNALRVLEADGFTARRNGVGVIVEVSPREKARPIHSLSRADIHVTDFETE